MPECKSGSVFLPGDVLNLPHEVTDKTALVVIGPGFRKGHGGAITSSQCGILRMSESPETYWLDTRCNRYIPIQGDNVVGIISHRLADGWKVDIGSADLANLNSLAFEGASKKNKPNLKSGDVIYAKLALAIKDMEPELTCVYEDSGKSAGLGPICMNNDGLVSTVPLQTIRRLLHPQSELIKFIGSAFKFEITIGMNGKMWLKSGRRWDTVTIMRIIRESLYLNDAMLYNHVCNCVQEAKRF